MPMKRRDYPPEWEAVSRHVRFVRAGGRCEWPGCTARHGQPHPITGSRVVLTTAHLPIDANGVPVDKHDKRRASPYHLLALCQQHHLCLDHADHIRHAQETRRGRRAVGSLFGEEENRV